MANEVMIIVRSHNDVNRGFDSARADVTRWADESAKLYTQRMALNMRQFGRQVATTMTRAGQEMGTRLGDETSANFRTRLLTTVSQVGQRARTVFTRAGQDIGDEIGRSASERITEHIRRGSGDTTTRVRSSGGTDTTTRVRSSGGTDTDRDRDRNTFRNLIRSAAGAGINAAQSFGQSFVSGIQSFFTSSLLGQVMTVVAIGIAGALAIPLTSAISATITSALLLGLGGGVIALGIAGAFRDPRIQAAGTELKDRLVRLFEEFGKPFRGPVLNFLENFARFLKDISPDMKELAESLAPLADRLGDGIIGFLQNLTPGILDALKDAEPIVKTLADRLPDIGQALGDFFRKIGEQGDDATVFFNDLITLITLLLKWLAAIIATFTSMYANIRNFVRNAKAAFLEFVDFVIGILGRMLDAATAAMSWIPSIGGKLKGAQAAFNVFRRSVNAELNRINAERAVGQIANLRRHLNSIAGTHVVNIAMRITGEQNISRARHALAKNFAHGGIKGAASGMTAGGLTWVGERGPELVDLPTGSTVRSSGDSLRMLEQSLRNGGAGQPGVLRAVVDQHAERTLMGVLLNALRLEIAAQGGNVQQVLGRA